MMPAMRGQALRSVNFPRGAKAYEKDDIPVHNLMAKKEVLAAKVPDPLGLRAAGWNNSTKSENMMKFPDRQMMRQLAAYDSHKRADFNYRAEELDSVATAKYVPRASKFQVNERGLDVPKLQEPFGISRCEFPTHSALADKPRWDPSTGAGGDPYGVEKAIRERLEHERVENLEYSRRHPPKQPTETLVQREERFLREQRAAKAAMRAAKAEFGSSSTAGSSSGLMAGGVTANTAALLGGSAMSGAAGGSYGRSAGAFGATKFGIGSASRFSPVDPSQMVPVKKTTSWSLGGF